MSGHCAAAGALGGGIAGATLGAAVLIPGIRRVMADE